MWFPQNRKELYSSEQTNLMNISKTRKKDKADVEHSFETKPITEF